MRINLLSLFSFLAVFGLSTNIFAQNSYNSGYIDLNGSNSIREKIFPTKAYTDLQICGLQKGEEYTFYLSEEGETSGISTTTNGNYQKTITLKAQDDCQDLALYSNYKQDKAQEPPFVSVSCKTCENKENTAAKSMMGVIGVPNLNASALVQDVFIGGDCFETSGATTSGGGLSIGTFSGALPLFGLGFDEGIILSTGYVSGTTGPSTNFNSNQTGGPSSDPDLESIATAQIRDVAILEFDFVPTVDQVSFEYVFASEEYCQFAPPNASNVNDIFGFFLSGPGIAGTINIAEVSAGVPVSINNVNPVTNAEFFNANGDNCGGVGAGPALFGYNGYTDVFTAVANVIPCETYHIKLAIADGGDDLWDSSVFLKSNSFDAGGAAIGTAEVPITGGNDAFESDECGNAFFTFTRESGDLFTPVVVEYTIGGTATNGVDYTGLPNSVTIPPGAPFTIVPVTILEDDIAEGMETITLFIFGACTCTTAEVSLNIFDLADLQVNVPDVEYCSNLGAPAVISATADGGVPLYFYDWGDGPLPVGLLTPPPIPTETTSYTVTVTDMCGSEGVGTGTVTVLDLEAVLDGDASLCGNSGSASLDVNFSGASGPFEIFYSIDGEMQPEITDIMDNPYTLDISETGTYALEIVTTDGCLGDASGSIIVAGSSTELTTAFTDADCSGTSSGSIDLTVTNPDGAVDFIWSNGSTLEDQASLPAGDYTVTVTSGGCEIIESFTLAENPEITASVVSTQGVDCSNPTIGEIDIDSGGGNGTLMYSWSNAATTEDLTGLASGTYSVTISDIDGCEVILDNIMVTGSTDVPTAVAVQSGNIDCDNMMVTLSATGSTTGADITYEWVDQDSNVIETGPDADEITVGTAGTYTLTVTNTDGDCFAQAPLTVTIDNQEPDANAGTIQTLDCNNGTVQLNGTASANGDDISYEWTGPSGAVITNGTTNTATVDMIGTYTLTVTNAVNGCSNTSTVEVDEDMTDPTIMLGTTPDLDCSTEDVDLDATGSSAGGFSYLWTTNGTGNILGATTLTPNVDAEGDYVLVITNDNTGCTSTETVTVDDVSELPDVSIATPDVITCSMDSIMLDASASDSGNGLNIEWVITGGSGSISDPSSLTPFVDGGGTFLLTISNPTTGCETQMPVTVTENTTPPVAIIDNPDQINCDDPTVTLTTNSSSSGAGISYAWSVISGTGTIDASTANAPIVDAPGTYELIVTDDNTGCSAATNVVVTGDPETPVAVVDYDSDIDCNNISANITGAGSSVGGGFAYEWDLDGTVLTGENSFSLNNLTTPGTYTLTVSNINNGCESSNFVTIALDTLVPIAVAVSPDMLDCVTSEIELDGSASSQSPDIIYDWTAMDNSAFTTSSDTITPGISAVGTYYLTVTNTVNGCVAMDSVVVSSNEDLPMISIEQPDAIDCIDETQEITSTVTGVSSDITYVWTGTGITEGANTSSPTVEESGTFTLEVTDNESGCSSTGTIVVDDISAQPIANAGMPAALDCDNNTLQLSAGASMGLGTLTYEWTATEGGIIDTDNTLVNPTISAAGTYTVVVTDESNGCQESAEVIITGDVTVPVAEAGLTAEINCNNESISLDGTGSSDNNVSYLWSAEDGGTIPAGQETIIDPVITTAGTYYLTVTSNGNNCNSIDSVIITSSVLDPDVSIEQPNAIDCVDLTQIITSSATATSTDISYAWTGTGIVEGANTNVPTVEEGGTFTLTVTDNANGCTTTETIVVDDERELPIADAGLTDVVNCDNETLELNAGASTGIGTLTYEWTAINGGVIDANADMLNPTISTAGTYIVLVTDESNGCEQTAEVIITDDFAAPIAIAGMNDQFNCGDESLSLNGAGSSTGDVTYLWTAEMGGSIPAGQEGLIDPEIMTAGTYILLVENNENGCTSTDQVIITEDENAPILQVDSEGDITCLDDIIDLTATISNVGTDFDYTWTIVNGIGNFESGETSLTPAVDAPGTYELSVVNNENNCDAVYSITIDEDTEDPAVALTVSNIIDCNFEEATLNTAGSDNEAGFDLVWTNDAGQTIPNGTENPMVTVEGQYTLTITNTDNGCFESQMVTVVEDTEVPTVVATSDSDITCQEDMAPLSGIGSSIGDDFSYTWTNTATGEIVGMDLNITTGQQGDYELVVMNTVNGCFDSQITNVGQDADFPVIQVAEAEVLNCITTETELNGTGSAIGDDISYLWTVVSGTGTITGGVTTLNPTIDGPGTYELTVSNAANDCADTQQVIVTENTEEPTITVGEADDITCTETEVTLSANSTNGTNFMWTGAADIQNPSSANPIVTTAGTYTVTATHNETGCEGTATVSVADDLDLPTVNAGTDYLINCETGSVTLSGTSDATNADYIWTSETGEEFTGQTIDVTSGGLYTLTVTNLENECTDSDNTEVESEQPTGLTIDETAADCISGFGSVVFSDVIGGEAGYTFSIDDGETFTQNTAFTQLESGSYNVIVQDIIGCEYSQEFIIDAPEELTVTMDDMEELKLGESYQFDPQINKDEDILVSILWTPEDSLSCIDCLTPLATPTESARYTILLKDSLGCTATASTLLIVNRQSNVYIPSAFSPNDDSNNEEFYVFADERNVEEIVSFQVFNRWGETVHEFFSIPANAPDFGWDGTYRGQPMNPGVFAYVVKVKMTDGRTEIFTGDVTLQR